MPNCSNRAISRVWLAAVVTLPGNLRFAAALLREGCVVRGAAPRSGLSLSSRCG